MKKRPVAALCAANVRAAASASQCRSFSYSFATRNLKCRSAARCIEAWRLCKVDLPRFGGQFIVYKLLDVQTLIPQSSVQRLYVPVFSERPANPHARAPSQTHVRASRSGSTRTEAGCGRSHICANAARTDLGQCLCHTNPRVRTVPSGWLCARSPRTAVGSTGPAHDGALASELFALQARVLIPQLPHFANLGRSVLTELVSR